MSIKDDNIPLADDDPQGNCVLLFFLKSVIKMVEILINLQPSLRIQMTISIELNQVIHCRACTMKGPVQV